MILTRRRSNSATDRAAGLVWRGHLAGVALGLLLCAASSGVRAQSKTGTSIGQFLLIEPSARVAAMGNAGVTTFGEPMAAYYNPGALGHLEQSGGQFTHSLWLADITYDYGAVALRLGESNTALVTVTALNSGDIAVRTVEQPKGTGEQYHVSNVALGVGYGRRITDRFSAGVQAKFVRETIWNSTMSALALDFGILYHLPFRAYLGASLSNFGNRGSFSGRDLRIRFDRDPRRFGDNSSLPAALETEDFPLPVFFRVGLGLPVAIGLHHEVVFVADAFHPSDNYESISLGVEWTFLELLSLRAGYQNLFLEDTEAGLSLGTGLRQRIYGYRLHFDYAWNDYGVIGGTQRFSLAFGF